LSLRGMGKVGNNEYERSQILPGLNLLSTKPEFEKSLVS